MGLKINIMIVDDKPENLLALDALLKTPDLKDRINIVKALSGAEALGRLLEDDFGLILLDVQMPDMDGFEVAALLRKSERNSATPIIFVTAINKESKHVFEGYEVGAVDYLFKPIDPHITVSKVRVFVQLAEQRRSLEKMNYELAVSNEELQRYGYAVAHDIQEPLAVIQSYLKLIKRRYGGKLDEDFDEFLQFGLDSSDRMRNLIKDLLKYAAFAMEASDQRQIDLNSSMREVEKNLKHLIDHNGVKIQYEPLPKILFNEWRIIQLLQNIIGNAIKFRGEQPPVIELTVKAQGNGHLFSIKDNGIGIASDRLKTVFNLFERLHQKKGHVGNGLGLAICRSIIEKYHGQIWIESQEGIGTTVFFTLPDENLGG